MNLSTWSRADLIGELLSPTPDAIEIDGSAVCEARPAYTAADPRAALVTHKIGVARELLMRDLQAQMKDGPIMGSPQALRDWLRLYCAGLEHEVFLVLYLNARHVLIDTVPMFRGTLTQTPQAHKPPESPARSHRFDVATYWKAGPRLRSRATL